jgi:hypothetical protein
LKRGPGAFTQLVAGAHRFFIRRTETPGRDEHPRGRGR